MTALFSRLRTISVPCILALLAVIAACTSQPPDASSLLKTAASGTGQSRYLAIDDLGERHEHAVAVVPELQKLLDDEDDASPLAERAVAGRLWSAG